MKHQALRWLRVSLGLLLFAAGGAQGGGFDLVAQQIQTAMAWSGGRIGDCSGEPAHRRRASTERAMRTTIRRYAATAGLIGLLALTAASSSVGQVRTQAPAGNEVAQYCSPQDESTDAHEFYCRSEV
jgi:hypothetical protein